LYRSISAAGDDYPAAQLLLCQVLGAQGRWVEARGCFSLIKDPKFCDPRDMLRLSEAALASGERVLPEMALRAMLESTTERLPALRLLVHLGTGQYAEQEMLVLYEELAALDRDDALSCLMMADIYQRNRMVSQAIDAYEEALRRSVNAAQGVDARTQLVELYLTIEDVAAARKTLDQLLPSGSATTSLRMKNARLLRLEAQPQEALAEVNGVLDKNADSVAALTLRGVVRLDLDQPQEAAVDLERVIALQPGLKEAHYKLAQAYRRLGRFEEAQQHLAISARLNRLSQVILTLETRLKDDPTNLQLLGELSRACREAGQTERADQWQRRAASLQ